MASQLSPHMHPVPKLNNTHKKGNNQLEIGAMMYAMRGESENEATRSQSLPLRGQRSNVELLCGRREAKRQGMSLY